MKFTKLNKIVAQITVKTSHSQTFLSYVKHLKFARFDVFIHLSYGKSTIKQMWVRINANSEVRIG